MRTVNLGSIEGALTARELALVQRKTRHLTARMEEFLPDGLEVTHGHLEETGWGWVRIRLPRLDSHKAAAILQRQYHISSCPVSEDGKVFFLVSNRVSFEDMDYVQAAVTELFYLQ